MTTRIIQERKARPNYTNLVGQKFGRLTVVSLSRLGAQKKRIWNCICECGRATEAWTDQLTTGRKLSCGCDDPRQYTKVYGRVPLTAERLRQVMSYDRETGELRWLVEVGKAKIGERAGVIGKRGHRVISVDGKIYRAARLAWMHVTGYMPENLIDHRNTVPTDDSWDNLRPATSSQNARNSRKKSKNPDHLKGAYFNKDTGHWFSAIRAGGKSIGLGTFSTQAEAHAAYCAAALELHGEFARAG